MMERDRAFAIVSAICNRWLVTEALADHLVGSLEHVTLAEMIEAKAIVEAENKRPGEPGKGKTIHVIPDDRLLAAAYVFESYTPSRTPILSVPHAGSIKQLGLIVRSEP